jgi:hypothetical protein
MLSADVELDNNTQGNQSYIDKLSQFSAISLLAKVERVLVDIANIDLFNKDYEESDVNVSIAPNSEGTISVLFGNKGNSKQYAGTYYRDVFVQIVSDIVVSNKMETLTSLISISEPTTSQIIGTSERISPKGTKLTKPVESTDYYVYVNFSKDDLHKQISKLADLTKLPVIFEKW